MEEEPEEKANTGLEEEGRTEGSRTKETGEHVPGRCDDKTASFYKH